jgi:hypothetical protein
MTQPLTQREIANKYLEDNVEPISKKLEKLGARHAVVGYLPEMGGGAMYIGTNGGDNKLNANMLRDLARGLMAYADQLEKTNKKSPLILPN